MGIRTSSIAYVKGDTAPWRSNGIGVEVAKGATVKQMLRAAKLDWTVSKRPLAYLANRSDGLGQDVEHFDNHFALVNSRGKVLDVCGSRYLPTQNEAAFNFFDDLIDKGDAKMDTVGSLAGGRIVFGLAKLNEGFQLPGKDRVEGYIFLGVPHIQGKSLIARVVFQRDVCNNTMSVAMRTSGKVAGGDVFRMNHRNEFNEVQRDKAKAVIGVAKEQVKTFAKQAQKLHKHKLDDAETAALIAKTFQPDWDGSVENLSPKMKAIMDAHKNAPGAQPGTAWGAFNAVTYFTDHVASRSDEKRLHNAWLGRTARQKEDVLHNLLAA